MSEKKVIRFNDNSLLTIGDKVVVITKATPITFTIDGTSYTVDPGTTWGGWLATSDCPSNIVNKYDKYVVESSGYMLLGSDGECVLLSDAIISDNFSIDYSWPYCVIAIDMDGCYYRGTQYTHVDFDYDYYIAKCWTNLSDWVNRKESMDNFYYDYRSDGNYSLWFKPYIKNSYPAEIIASANTLYNDTPSPDTYLNIDSGGYYGWYTAGWVP